MARRKAKRGAWGQGYSVYQNADGSWTGAVQISTQPRKYKRARHPDRPTAEKWCQEQVAQLARGVDLARGAQTVADMADVWYNDVKAPSGIKPKTLENYRHRIELYILPALGDRKLDSLRAEDIQRFVNRLRAQNLADSTIRDAFNVLWSILETARKWRYIPENPCDLVNKPKVEKDEPIPFTIAELGAILMEAGSHRQAAAFWTAATFGLRLGELLGLRWADLDWDRAEITISQQVQGISEVEQTPDGPVTHYKNVISPSPKTKAGRRTIPVPPGLIERLRAHWRQQQEERRYLGVKWHEHGLIFASEVGTPVMPRNFESTWYRLRERAGIGADRNFHIFRHTCATLMGAAGVLEEVRAAILGHSKRTMTQYYTHAVDDAKRGAVEVVERRLIEAVEEKRRKEKAG